MEKNINYYLNLPYTIELQQEPEEGWFIRVKELRGCMSQGDTPEEAFEMIRDAMQGWLEIALEKGIPIPEPRPDEDYSGKFVVRVPKSLHRRLVEEAQNEGISLNQFVNYALVCATSGSQPEGKLLKDKKVTSLNKWPGLSVAAKNALNKAGLEEEAGIDDERLFSSWLGNMCAQIESCIIQENNPLAIRYIEYTTTFLHQHIDRSPVLENIVTIMEQQRQLIKHNAQLQRALVRQVVKPDVQERIKELYKPSIGVDFSSPEEDITSVYGFAESKQKFIKETRSKKLYWNNKREAHDE